MTILPGRTADRNEWNAGLGAGADGVRRDLVGVGVRGIDDNVGGVVAKEASEAIDTAEATDARRHQQRQ